MRTFLYTVLMTLALAAPAAGQIDFPDKLRSTRADGKLVDLAAIDGFPAITASQCLAGNGAGTALEFTTCGAGGGSSTWIGLTDTPAAFIAGRFLQSTASAIEFRTPGQFRIDLGIPAFVASSCLRTNGAGTAMAWGLCGPQSFLALNDTPAAFAPAGNFIRINSTRTALEFLTPAQLRTDIGADTYTFAGLADTPNAISAGLCVAGNSVGTAIVFQACGTGGGGGVSTFTALTDTPAALGTAGQLVAVNGGGNALAFIDPSGGGLSTGTFQRTALLTAFALAASSTPAEITLSETLTDGALLEFLFAGMGTGPGAIGYISTDTILDLTGYSSAPTGTQLADGYGLEIHNTGDMNFGHEAVNIWRTDSDNAIWVLMGRDSAETLTVTKILPQGAQGPAGADGTDGMDATGDISAVTAQTASPIFISGGDSGTAQVQFNLSKTGLPNLLTLAGGDRIPVGDVSSSPPANTWLSLTQLAAFQADGVTITAANGVLTAAVGGGGSTTFIGLTDTPTAFGAAGQITAVNAGATALEFTNGPSSWAQTGNTDVIPRTKLGANLGSGVWLYNGAGNVRQWRTLQNSPANYSGDGLFVVDDNVFEILPGGNTGDVFTRTATSFDMRPPAAGSFTGLTDTPAAITAGQCVQGNPGGTALVYGACGTGGGGGATAFTELTDTPANYTGAADQYVAVNGAGTALEFRAISQPMLATTTFPGLVQLATDAEAAAGTPDRALTTSNVDAIITDGGLNVTTPASESTSLAASRQAIAEAIAAVPAGPPGQAGADGMDGATGAQGMTGATGAAGADGAAGAATFTALTDTPSAITADECVAGNSAGTALEFTTCGTGSGSFDLHDDVTETYPLRMGARILFSAEDRAGDPNAYLPVEDFVDDTFELLGARTEVTSLDNLDEFLMWDRGGAEVRPVSATVMSTYFGAGGGGATTFVGLTDTPSSITADQCVAGNSGGTALEFTACGTGGTADGVVDGATVTSDIPTTVHTLNLSRTIGADVTVALPSPFLSTLQDATLDDDDRILILDPTSGRLAYMTGVSLRDNIQIQAIEPFSNLASYVRGQLVETGSLDDAIFWVASRPIAAGQGAPSHADPGDWFELAERGAWRGALTTSETYALYEGDTYHIGDEVYAVTEDIASITGAELLEHDHIVELSNPLVQDEGTTLTAAESVRFINFTGAGVTATLDALGVAEIDVPGGATAFTELSDTPAALGTAGQVVQVNSGATALEFVDASSSGASNLTFTSVGTWDATLNGSQDAYQLFDSGISLPSADELHLVMTHNTSDDGDAAHVLVRLDDLPTGTTSPNEWSTTYNGVGRSNTTSREFSMGQNRGMVLGRHSNGNYTIGAQETQTYQANIFAITAAAGPTGATGSAGATGADGADGSTTFAGLTDTPASITADQCVAGNAGGTALEFTTCGTGGGTGDITAVNTAGNSGIDGGATTGDADIFLNVYDLPNFSQPLSGSDRIPFGDHEETNFATRYVNFSAYAAWQANRNNGGISSTDGQFDLELSELTTITSPADTDRVPIMDDSNGDATRATTVANLANRIQTTTTFQDLSNTPTTITADMCVAGNSAGDALVFGACGSTISALTKAQADSETDTTTGTVSGLLLFDAITTHSTGNHAITQVGRLPTTETDAVLYVTHDYTAGTQSNVTVTPAAIGDDYYGWSSGTLFTAGGSVSRDTTCVNAMIGANQAGNDYIIDEIWSTNRDCLAGTTAVQIGTSLYSDLTLRSSLGDWVLLINNAPTLSSSTFTINLWDADTTTWLWQGSTSSFRAGLYAWDPDDSSYDLLTGGNDGDITEVRTTSSSGLEGGAASGLANISVNIDRLSDLAGAWAGADLLATDDATLGGNGTGARSVSSLSVFLAGLGLSATSGVLSVDNVPITRGGTGATTAAGARTNLGTDDASNITTGTLPDARLSAAIARTAAVPDDFTDLDDTPAALGTAGQVVAVNSGGTALEFVDGGGSGDIEGVTTSNTSGLDGGATSGTVALELDLGRLGAGGALAALDRFAFYDVSATQTDYTAATGIATWLASGTNSGIGIADSGGALAMYVAGLSTETGLQGTDRVPFMNDSEPDDPTHAATLTSVATFMAGTNITANSGVLSVDLPTAFNIVDDLTAITSVQSADSIAFADNSNSSAMRRATLENVFDGVLPNYASDGIAYNATDDAFELDISAFPIGSTPAATDRIALSDTSNGNAVGRNTLTSVFNAMIPPFVNTTTDGLQSTTGGKLALHVQELSAISTNYSADDYLLVTHRLTNTTSSSHRIDVDDWLDATAGNALARNGTALDSNIAGLTAVTGLANNYVLALGNAGTADRKIEIDNFLADIVDNDTIEVDTSTNELEVADNAIGAAKMDPESGSVGQVMMIGSGGNPAWQFPFEFPRTVSTRDTVLDTGSGTGDDYVVTTSTIDTGFAGDPAPVNVTANFTVSGIVGSGCQVRFLIVASNTIYGNTVFTSAGEKTVTSTVTFAANKRGNAMPVVFIVRDRGGSSACTVDSGAELIVSM